VKILLTRPLTQARVTENFLHEAGIEACCFAVQRMDGQLPPELHAATAAIFADATPIDGLIFISANAVEFGWPWVKNLPVRKLFAVGAATSHALLEHVAAQTEIIQPVSQFDSEGLLAMPQLAGVSGQRLIIIRGLGLTPGRDLLASTLRERGARVDDAFCYTRTVETPENRVFPAIIAELNTGAISMVNVQSGETLTAFETLFAPTAAQRKNLRLLVPHHRIAALAVNNGYKRVEVTGVGDNCLKSYLLTEASHGKPT
jgi:uroporphyrinogen-III synthase